MKGRSDFTTRPMIPRKGVQHYECVIRFRYTADADDHSTLPWELYNNLDADSSVLHVSDPSITRLTPERD